ncbi:MAG: hypothetical protein WAZ19_01845 [Anaerolineae bacterium]
MTVSDPEKNLVVRVSLWKMFQGLAISACIIIVGIITILLPTPQSKINVPGYDTLVFIAAMLGILLGASLFVSYGIYIIKRRSIKWPILTLNVHGITDHHHNLFIPFTDIKRMWLTEDTRKLLPLQRIQLDMVDPQRYAVVEQRLKRRGWYNTDVILVLTLASAKDFRLARDYIRRHIKGVEDDGIRTLD